MIRAFLFDMGNVLIHFSHDRMYQQIGKLVGASGAEARLVCERTDWLSRCDLQAVSDDVTAQQLGALFGVTLDPLALWHAISDIFWRNESIEPIVEQLARLRLPMVLVSNTCAAHIRWVTSRFNVLDHFPHKILSYELAAAKPSQAIFAAATRVARCPPTECLFIDDTAGHVEAARRLEFDAVRYQSADQLVEELETRGIEMNASKT